MRIRGFAVIAGILVLTLADGSGQDAIPYIQRAHYAVNAGKFRQGLGLYRLAYQVAKDTSPRAYQLNILNNIAACQLALFHYKDATELLLRARRLAEESRSPALVGSVDANLAALYNQTGDLAAAETYARQSLFAFSQTNQKQLQARTSMTLAEILSRPGLQPEAEKLFREGIAESVDCSDWSSAATGWLHFGSALVQAGRLQEADQAFTRSDDLMRKSRHLSGESVVLWNLGKLRFRQNKLREALKLIDSAISLSPVSGGRISRRLIYQTRAQIELAQANYVGALRDARIALKNAQSRRVDVVPDSDDRVKLDEIVDETVSVLIEAGNRVYRQTGDRNILRESFEAAEENRAESLEAILPASSNWRRGASTVSYRAKLSELLAEQAVVLRVNTRESRERLAWLHTELSQLQTGTTATVRPESGSVLERVRRNLPPASALLSFRLGDRVSWLWTVDHGRLQLYPLPPKAVLVKEINDFQEAIRNNETEHIVKSGHRLFRDLLGGPDRSFQKCSQWFVSLDEPLYTLPFPSLVVERGNHGPVYLTETKAIEFLPGAQLFQAPHRDRLINRKFLLAGDGVYNRADPRFVKQALIRPVSWGMARLPGSGEEVQFAADLWRHTVLLTGRQLTKTRLLNEIDHDPDVIHIASHVVEGQDRWHSGILALGLNPSGEPDLLTPIEIQLHPLHSRLVVMTGCSSGSGEVVAASGLMGLTRAWLAAGADEVLATRWPTMDESRDGLISSFYLHLLKSPDGNIPEALRQARRDMIARGGWRAEPRYWSSFFLIGVR
ncbi:MAG TPA: CHAT domain-containing tetratricopeptide repeat protein [Bryobacteraceae bacterium]|jgi:CHAT domain-containing protein/Flp pilus assembly protein TadD